jgi:hypothetical protein
MVPVMQKPGAGHETTERSAPAAIVSAFDHVPAALGTAVVAGVDEAVDVAGVEVVGEPERPPPPPQAARSSAATAIAAAVAPIRFPGPPPLTLGREKPNGLTRRSGGETTYRAR